MAEDNYQALLNFFQKFPSFASNDFYVFAESYGGIYAPTLSQKIASGSNQINFKVAQEIQELEILKPVTRIILFNTQSLNLIKTCLVDKGFDQRLADSEKNSFSCRWGNMPAT